MRRRRRKKGREKEWGGVKRHATDADDDNEFWAPPAGLTPTAIINWAANGNGIS